MAVPFIHLDPNKSNQLKGWAIAAVVLLHTLAYLKGIYTTSQYNLFFIALDQLSRFCVPLFIMISAYGLTRKYGGSELKWWPYLKSRVFKLIPLYLFWSFLSLGLMTYVPEWYSAGDPIPMWSILLLGQADYQLYFVSLIFQLYILYPILLEKVTRWPRVTLVSAVLIQILVYAWFSESLRMYITLPSSLHTDGLQYVIFASWIAYFVIGIRLALLKNISAFWKKYLPVVALLTLLFVIYDAWSAIKNGMDPLFALKFTRLSVMLFAMTSSISLIITNVGGDVMGKISEKFKNTIQWVGRESYLIFLAHTIALRIVFSFSRHWMSLSEIAVVIVIWLAAIFISKKFLS